jgi:hypothetical protein
MKRILVLLLAGLTGCASAGSRGADAYHDGMTLIGYDIATARGHFQEADAALAEALADPSLTTRDRVTAASLRIRALIELDRHADARALAAVAIPGFEPNLAYEGDRLGLAILRARLRDPERAFADLVMVDRQIQTELARMHLAWEQVRVLTLINTPASRAEAAKICERWPGRLDFDAQRKQLTTP